MSKILLIVLTLVIVVGGLYYGITTLLKNQNNDSKPLTITVWGIKEDPAVMAKVIEGYKVRHPNVTVNYSAQTLENYRQRVQNQISSGQSADIVAVHNSWMPNFYQGRYLAPAPAEILDSNTYNSLFYKVAGDSFVSGGKVYGIPMEIDGLALFVNQDILKGQNIGLPKTWDEVVNTAVLTTVTDKDGAIQTGGLGMGETANVEYWSEIVGLLLLQQPNAKIDNPDTTAGKEAVQFFKNPSGSLNKKLWSPTLDLTTKAFSQGKLTFYLGQAQNVNQISKANPNLNFTVIPVPQLPVPDKNVSFGCFWGYGVSSQSKNQKAAWQFLKFLTDAETEKYIYEQETQTLGLGRPYARTDLANELESNPHLGAFVKQGPNYQSWYLCAGTQDAGLNDKMIEAYKSGIDGNNISATAAEIPGILSNYTAPLPKK